MRFLDIARAGQAAITAKLSALDGQTFRADPWQRDDAELRGEGLTMVLEGGAVIEKGGVAFSAVTLPRAPAAIADKIAGEIRQLHAVGLSLVIHPRNPYVPTTHLNVRHLVAEGPEVQSWYGGGFDLTPFYPFAEDCRAWHQAARALCLRHFDAERYARYKEQCDRYFYLPHRGETRGIGGLFYDDLRSGGEAFSQDLIATWLEAFVALIARRGATPYGARERRFQAFRRGRYVEFNLLYDRGTHFGLQSGGRTHSILMSLPPEVAYPYDYRPESGSPEAALSEYLQPRAWL